MERRGDNKGTWRNVAGDGTVLYLDYGGGYKTICVCQDLELYTKRVCFTECKLYLNKSDPSKKERMHSCKIFNVWCWLDNYTLMVRGQYMVTLIILPQVGSPFLSESAWARHIFQRGKRAELAAIFLYGGCLAQWLAVVSSCLWHSLKIFHLFDSPSSFA